LGSNTTRDTRARPKRRIDKFWERNEVRRKRWRMGEEEIETVPEYTYVSITTDVGQSITEEHHQVLTIRIEFVVTEELNGLVKGIVEVGVARVAGHGRPNRLEFGDKFRVYLSTIVGEGFINTFVFADSAENDETNVDILVGHFVIILDLVEQSKDGGNLRIKNGVTPSVAVDITNVRSMTQT
jgi:hypothetical protein